MSWNQLVSEDYKTHQLLFGKSTPGGKTVCTAEKYLGFTVVFMDVT